MPHVVIAGYARSPFSFAHKGELAKTRPDDLAAAVVRALVDRTKINPADIEDLIVGCAFPEGEQGLNIARLIGFIAQLPQSVAGATVNRFCGSSMQAIHMAAGSIQMGAGDAFICAGVESMTRVPIMGFNLMPNPALAEKYPEAYVSMGVTAENVARQHHVSRHEQEIFSVLSQAKASAAQNAGNLSAEIVPIHLQSGLLEKDGCIRSGTTIEKLAELAPMFEENGTVTAGTSSPLTDGAAAVLVASEDYARAHGLPVLARIKAIAVAGCAPESMGLGPIEATNKALQRAGLTMKDIDIIELNEAFASQAIACIREMDMDIVKVNRDGGAIALGHPLGATGARITGKAASLLKREGKQFALATQCIGGGQGIATILEAV
jgi:acetyl-CoA acyltransferase